MDDAMWMGSIFGPLLLIMGVWQFLKFKEMDELLAALKVSPACIAFMGFFNMLLGFGILSVYNEFHLDLTLLVTVLGYLLVIRGLLVLFLPKRIFALASKLIHSKYLRYVGAVTFLWGLGLTWLGFYM